MRLIDADDLKAKIMIDAPDFMDGGSSITKAFIMAMLGSRAATPTIDAVQVVRCKDCKHKEESVSPSWEAWCNRLHCGCDLDWFCADGERNPTQTNTKNNALDCVKGGIN